MNNAPAIKLVTGRYSAHVSTFNCHNVSEVDSDNNYFLNKELAELATAALGRAPEIKPSGNRRALLVSADLGNCYRTVRQNLTSAELARYNEIQGILEDLNDKYNA